MIILLFTLNYVVPSCKEDKYCASCNEDDKCEVCYFANLNYTNFVCEEIDKEKRIEGCHMYHDEDCVACFPGLYVTPDGECKECGGDCWACEAPGKCELCNDGSEPKDDKCPGEGEPSCDVDNCLFCDGPSCAFCNEGYALFEEERRLEEDDEENSGETDATCVKMSDCYLAVSSTKCGICLPGFHHVDDECVSSKD